MKNLRTRALGYVTVAYTMGLVFAASARAEVPATVDVYAGIAHAAGVHAVYYTATLSDLSTGAVDNRYPLTNTYQDVAPSSNARASTEDGGPLLNTLYALGKSSKEFPYAVAQFPATPQAPADSKCDPNQPDAGHQCPNGTASAHAREVTATADGVYSGNPGTAGSPSFDNATAHNDSIVNADGSLVVSSHSHVGTASFGGGALVVKNTDVVTKVVSAAGIGRATAVVAPGDVTYLGQPVRVTDQGVTVGGQTVPVGGLSTGNGVSALSFKVFTVAPESSHDGPRASILATGLHVVVTQQAIAGSNAVPPNSVEYILGEGQADGFAIPAGPQIAATADLSGFPAGNNLGTVGQTDESPTTATTTLSSLATVTTPSDLATRAAPNAGTKGKRFKPLLAVAAIARPNLALMFFAWEVLIMVTAASLVWRRRLRRAEDELD
ncbi:MAG: hypothetical protein ABR573_10330 [Candidatus Dormibacteria bacterium]